MCFPRSTLFNTFLLLCSFLLILAGCSSNSNDGSDGGSTGGGTPVALEDPDNAFAAIGISTVDELRTRISTNGALALTVEIQNANPGMSSENTIRLLKANNRNIEYRKLEDSGINTAVIGKLKSLKYSPVSVEQSIQLPDQEKFPLPQVTDRALALLNGGKLKKLNRKLRLAGQAPLSMDEFLALQNAFGQVDMVNNFGNLDQQFQNIPARDSIDRSASPMRSRGTPRRLKGVTPTGYTLVNAVDELKENGSGAEFPFENNPCQINRIDLPMPIAQSSGPVNTGLVTTEGGDATVVFPETGIAVIVVAGSSAHRLKMTGRDNAVLDERDLGDTIIYYLPVTNDDLCKPFTFAGASAEYDVTLVAMIRPERINEHVFFNGAQYISTVAATELMNENGSFNAKSYTFSTINSALPELDIIFEWDTDNESNASFDFVLHAPNGDVYSGTQADEGSIQSGAIPGQSGIWRLDILPKGSISIDVNGVVSGLTPVTSGFNHDMSLSLTTLISTDAQVQTKEFVLGTLRNVSLKTQGESGSFDEGEVTIDLNTNMSPKLNVPSYIEDIIQSGDKMNEDIALWQCWENSGKTGTEFTPDGECYIYQEAFLRKQHLYEVSHTFDYQNDPEVYQCRDQNGEVAECIRGELGPYNMANPSEAYKVQVVMNDYSKDMQRQYQDVEYLHVLSNYYDLYQNWKDRTVQVDNGQFPYDGLPYKTHEFAPCEADDSDCLTAALSGSYPRIPVVIETNRPIFGVPVERVNESTLPITFDYTASDQDVYDSSAANWAYLGFIASQALNAVTGNFVRMLCDTVELVDDLHDVELAAQDDPLGSARASINRYSSSDPFYGLHNRDSFRFFMSGLPEDNTEIDTYGQKLSYAQIACGAANIAASGYQFAQNTDLLLNLDYEQLGDAADVYRVIAGTSTAVNSALIMAEAEEIAELIRNGSIEEARKRLQTSASVNNLTDGTDLYDDLDSLLAGYRNEGSAGNGNNVLKSNAKYLLGTDKKTRAEVQFERVGSVPVSHISVALDRVKIISNYEDDDKAEIELIPFVGVVSDKPRSSDTAHSLFSDTEDIRDGNHAWNYLHFGNVADGQTLETPDTILYSESSCGSVAAVYVEVAVKEEDSLSLEDDDMIGIFSQTIKLEEIFNKNADFKWNSLGGRRYRLTITDYPVFNSSNQLSLENPLSDDYERQKSHNSKRKPSALVSLTIDVTMEDTSTTCPPTDTSLNVGVIGSGRDTYSMDMKTVGEITMAGSLLDVFKTKAIVGSESNKMITGTIISYGSEPHFLKKLFTYDINSFAGELAPVKEALTATKSMGRTFRDAGNALVSELSMVRLLSDNRLLFVISHDAGARIVIVTYTGDGVMTLGKSLLIKDIAGRQVFSLLNASLSSDRTLLMVPYVSPDYAGTDKEKPAYTRLNLYKIGDDNTITRLSANSLGNGAPATSVQFIDDSHVAVLTHKLSFGEGGHAWWPDWEKVQEDCTSEDLNCLFERVGKNILLFNINDENRLELTDSLDVFYTPPSEKNLKDYYPLEAILAWHYRAGELQLVSNIKNGTSILRLGLKLYQLNYDGQTKGYYFGNSSGYQNVRSLKYNAEGEYYCADGITCSGYLKSALKPSRDDTGYYTSDEIIEGFEFADPDRDLVLGFSNDKLQLLSLYDGAAYKGPKITGDIFSTEVSVAESNTVRFSFTVTDRDSSLAALTIEAIVRTVSAPGGYTGTNVTLERREASDGIIYCIGTIVTGADNSNLDETIVIRVSDGVYTSEKSIRITNLVPTIVIPFADRANGIEAWSTDGTSGNTEMLNNANSGSGDSIGSFNAEMHRFNDKYIYCGNLGDGSLHEPFAATIGGIAEQLKVIDEGNGGGQYSLPTDFTTLNDYVYFIARHSLYGRLLYRTDGTPAGTTLVKDISSENSTNLITSLNVINNKLLFFGNVGVNGTALWESDGTSGGTRIVTGLNWKLGCNVPENVILFNDRLIFSHFDSDGSNVELWVSDGTAAGTKRLKDIHPTGDSNPKGFVESGETLFFMADHDGNGPSLWKTDGTESGTQLVRANSGMNAAAGMDGDLYFISDDQTLWKSDGTESGTVMVNDLTTLPMTDVQKIDVHNNTLYFHVMWGETMKYTIHAVNPSVSYDLININSDGSGDAIQYHDLNIYEESIKSDLVYMTADDTHYSLWKHNIDDGNRLIKQTDK